METTGERSVERLAAVAVAGRFARCAERVAHRPDDRNEVMIVFERIARGVAAGAAGTAALNATTYLDMAVRGRGPSEVQTRAVDELASRAGVELGEGEPARHRRTAVGQLMGYGAGLAIGVCYAGGYPMLRRLPKVARGLALGAAAMAAADIPTTSLGLTDPAEWGASGWAADIVPHAVYGLVTAAVFDALTRNGSPAS